MLNKELYHELKMLSVRENKPIKDILKTEIEHYIEVHKEGNPQHLLTQYQENEDFMGFPAIALSPQNKRKYLKKMPKDMIVELRYNVQEWVGMLKEL